MKPAEPTAPAIDDLFSAPSNEPAMKPAVDDLFSVPSTNEPATQPSPPDEDLFSDPPKSSEAVPAVPANNLLDDLFNPPSDSAPTTPPASSVDDLFKSSSNDAAPEPKGESLPVSTDTDSEPNFDNLFSSPSKMNKADSSSSRSNWPSSVGEKPAADEKAAPESKKSVDTLDELFKTSNLSTEKNFNGAEFREWNDNTGDYSVKARLAVIYPDRIRLIKENGKYSTVPISRLSDPDRDYVTWVAASLSNGPAAKFVNTEINPGHVDQEMAR